MPSPPPTHASLPQSIAQSAAAPLLLSTLLASYGYQKANIPYYSNKISTRRHSPSYTLYRCIPCCISTSTCYSYEYFVFSDYNSS